MPGQTSPCDDQTTAVPVAATKMMNKRRRQACAGLVLSELRWRVEGAVSRESGTVVAFVMTAMLRESAILLAGRSHSKADVGKAARPLCAHGTVGDYCTKAGCQ